MCLQPQIQEYILDAFRTPLNLIKQDMRDNSELVNGMYLNHVSFCFSTILLPSGVHPKDVLSACTRGRRELKLSIIWPQPFYNMSMLQKKWLSRETANSSSLRKYHLKFFDFGLIQKLIRKRAEDPVESVGLVALQIPVKQHIFNHSHLGWYDNSARVLYGCIWISRPLKTAIVRQLNY